MNLINTHDWGRQVQLSYYSGPVPFNPPGTRMSKAWEFIGWNPIQSGDCYGHEARVVKHTNNGRSIYVKCIPMHWPLDNIPGECECEVWLELSGPAVKARCRLTNHRPDKTQYSARHQELPAVYVNGPFYRLMTYTGERPFSGDALTRIEKRAGEPGLASVLDDVERTLLEIAHSPARADAAELTMLQREIAAEGILFKIRITASRVRERQNAATRELARRVT